MARVPTLLMVSLLSAGAAFAQTAPPTQDIHPRGHEPRA